jgi:hypothetical protein
MKKLLAQEEAMIPALFHNLKRALIPLLDDSTYVTMQVRTDDVDVYLCIVYLHMYSYIYRHVLHDYRCIYMHLIPLSDDFSYTTVQVCIAYLHVLDNFL